VEHQGAQRVVPILLYHRVVRSSSAAARSPFSVTEHEFDEHLSLLRDSGARPVTVGELVALRRFAGDGGVAPGTVVVTFDDGYRDFAEVALPLLERHHVPCSLYVVSDFVGGTSSWTSDPAPLMDWSELRALADSAAGVEIGAHSARHLELDTAPADVAREEIVGSRATLEERLGQAVDSFAYPFGHHHKRVRQAVIDAGYRSACAVKNQLSPADDDPYSLARVTITAGTGLDRLSRILHGAASVAVADSGERLRTRGFRVFRRIAHRGHTGHG